MPNTNNLTLTLLVIHKRRPQGGGRGVKGKGTRADIGGGRSSKGGRPQKNFEES